MYTCTDTIPQFLATIHSHPNYFQIVKTFEVVFRFTETGVSLESSNSWWHPGMRGIPVLTPSRSSNNLN